MCMYHSSISTPLMRKLLHPLKRQFQADTRLQAIGHIEMGYTREPPSKCPDVVLQAIYGKVEDKKAAYDASLNRWWKEYADRKADEEDEHVADSLLYDRNHLPRAAPPPESVFEERAKLAAIASQMPFTAVTVKNGDSDHIKPAS